jgi:hypothetical protein
MTPTTPTTEKASPIRRTYAPLGTDQEGSHGYRTLDETIFAFDAAGRREYRFEIDDRPETVDDYVAHVETARGWESRRYASGFVDIIDSQISFEE